MSYDKNNEVEYTAGAPKKADIIIKSTQDIAIKQDEISEQTRLALSRMNEAIEMFSQNNNDAQYIVKQSGEIFDQLQSENSVLKQELLYLAKQSENIYAGLAEKINELSDTAKAREDTLEGLSYKLNDVAEQAARSESSYAGIMDRIAEIAEQNRRNERLFAALNDKISELSDRINGVSARPVVVEQTDRPVVEIDNSEILDKLNYIADQLRRNEGAHSMLADKFEILSMRVEQFGFESAKGTQQGFTQPVAPVAYPATTTVVKSDDIDYDKLAAKVADLISAREVISPDYIASKVAEQIVLPEVEASNIKLSIDEENIAKQVAQLIDGKLPTAHAEIDEDKLVGRIAEVVGNEVQAKTVAASVGIDEDKLAERIAEKVGKVQDIPVAAALDEEGLAERLAEKLGGLNTAVASANIDEEELADAIALKVGSLKSEDFEILVDDDGCTSISKEIANNLDYNIISNVIADKLSSALDLVAANAPDYEEMAERISEKITVAGVNEDAIADKAAAVLSNYLPEFDTDEIADKITGAVIDVVSAMPQPTLDSETVCNTISERLIESQEDHDYDIVIDEDGIYKITALISEEIEKETGARLDKMEEAIADLTELLTPEESEEKEELEAAAEEIAADDAEEEDYTKLSSILAAEIEKGTSSRFDKVEENIAKLSELVSGAVADDEYEEVEEVAEETEEPKLASEVISRLDSVEEKLINLTELLNGDEVYEEEVAEETEEPKLASEVISRLDSVEEKLVNLTELLNSDEVYEEEILEEGEAAPADISALREALAEEIEKSVTCRLDVVEEKLTGITDILSSEEEYEEEPEELEEELNEEAEASEEDYSDISAAVADEIERRVFSRLDSVEEKLNGITDILSSEEEYEEESVEEPEEFDEEAEASEEDFTDITAAVADEIERRVASRFDSVEEKLSSLTELMTPVEEEIAEAEETYEVEEEDYTRLSEAVADEIGRRVTNRLDSLEENVAKITLMVASGIDVQSDDANLREIVAAELEKGLNGRFDRVEEDLAKITEYVEGDIPVETDGRLDKIAEDVAKLSAYIEGEVSVETDARFEKIREDIERITEVLSSSDSERFSKVEDGIAEIKEMLANGVSVAADSVSDSEKTRKMEATLDEIKEMFLNGVSVVNDNAAEAEQANRLEETLAEIKEMLSKGADVTVEEVEDGYRESTGGDVLNEIKEMLAGGIVIANSEAKEGDDEHSNRVEYILTEIKDLLASDLQRREEAASAVAEAEASSAQFDEDALVTVRDLVDSDMLEAAEDDEEGDDDDFLIDVLDMDKFTDDELMPGELSEFGGVDFANMMKFKRSFIARIIQSNDENKQYYGEVKHALLSYKKVNSNVAWGAERFNKGRETIARMKIRGKTLCLYLALDPNNYKTSVYHHIDVSDNKSVAGTPMMVKIKSPLGVRKAIRLIDEMLAARNGEKKEIPERDYAAMYPYENIEELIEDGLVKDVRKK